MLKNHPCSIWARASSENYIWLYALFVALCEEYTFRYGRTHLTETKFIKVLSNIPKNISIGPLTRFALAMPNEFKHNKSEIKCYRNYYIVGKKHLCVWTKRKQPYWYK